MDKSEPDHRKDKGLPAAENSTVVQSDSFIRKKRKDMEPAQLVLTCALLSVLARCHPCPNGTKRPCPSLSPLLIGGSIAHTNLFIFNLQYVITGDAVGNACYRWFHFIPFTTRLGKREQRVTSLDKRCSNCGQSS